MKDTTSRNPKTHISLNLCFYRGFYVFLYFQQFVDLGPFGNKTEVIDFWKTIFPDFFFFFFVICKVLSKENVILK